MARSGGRELGGERVFTPSLVYRIGAGMVTMGVSWRQRTLCFASLAGSDSERTGEDRGRSESGQDLGEIPPYILTRWRISWRWGRPHPDAPRLRKWLRRAISSGLHARSRSAGLGSFCCCSEIGSGRVAMPEMFTRAMCDSWGVGSASRFAVFARRVDGRAASGGCFAGFRCT